MNSNEERLARLEVRLQEGFRRIGEKMEEGIDVPSWEEKWIELLREYERISDELDRTHDGPMWQVAMAGMGRREVIV